jgi:all-trans-nonaprenyl-diphosphate synthase
MNSVTSLFAPVEADLKVLAENLKSLVGARHPILYAAAEHLFSAGGKRVRPAIVLLIARATLLGEDITPRHRRLAEITEMIHTASLVHDDVLDTAETRRGIPTVHDQFGNRVAVLAGDFLFAQSSWYLANLDNLTVVKLLSQVIMDLAEGEIQQSLSSFDTEMSIESYLEKSYFKTASLLANSAKATAILSDLPEAACHKMYLYGRHLGLAFQIVDDILDFTSSAEVLGKPAGSDLAGGNLTAPVLYAMEEQPRLAELIVGEFEQAGDLEKALGLIHSSTGFDKSWALAKEHVGLALEQLTDLAPSHSKSALVEMGDYVLQRSH